MFSFRQAKSGFFPKLLRVSGHALPSSQQNVIYPYHSMLYYHLQFTDFPAKLLVC